MRNLSLLLLLLSLLTGCASHLMQPVDSATLPRSLNENEAAIVFLRPSSFGMAIQAPVIAAAGDELSLVGIVSAGDKLLHITTAGEHNFIVGGESAGCLTAHLAGGKFYYVQVVPRLGLWKARFTFEPVPFEEINTQAFKADMGRCTWRTPKAEAQQWYTDNLPSIRAKYQEALNNCAPKVIPPEYGSPELSP
jgi:hypothetical protein